MARTPQMMGIGRAAEFLGVDEGTLRRWHRIGEGPPRTRKGKRFYYVLEALREWLKDNAPPAAPEPKRPQAVPTIQSRASIALGR